MPRNTSRAGSHPGNGDAREDNVNKGQLRVTFIKDCVLSSSRVEMVKLRNPHTDQGTLYVVDKDKKTIHEIMAFNEGHRCWFIGQTIEANGKLYIISPMDATYLILPYLMKSPKTVPLEHLLEDEEFPDFSCLDAVVADKDFSHIADSVGSPDLCAWKYNEDNALAWLSGRVDRLAALLQDKKVPTSTAQSLTYICPMDPQQAKEAYTVLAHGIISEYLTEELSKKLHKHLKLPEKIRPKISGGGANQPTKKQKIEGPLEDYSKDNNVPCKGKVAMTAKEKALAKSAVGSKSIMSFFTKK